MNLFLGLKEQKNPAKVCGRKKRANQAKEDGIMKRLKEELRQVGIDPRTFGHDFKAAIATLSNIKKGKENKQVHRHSHKAR